MRRRTTHGLLGLPCFPSHTNKMQVTMGIDHLTAECVQRDFAKRITHLIHPTCRWFLPIFDDLPFLNWITRKTEAPFTQDAQVDLHANLRTHPLILKSFRKQCEHTHWLQCVSCRLRVLFEQGFCWRTECYGHRESSLDRKCLWALTQVHHTLWQRKHKSWTNPDLTEHFSSSASLTMSHLQWHPMPMTIFVLCWHPWELFCLFMSSGFTLNFLLPEKNAWVSISFPFFLGNLWIRFSQVIRWVIYQIYPHWKKKQEDRNKNSKGMPAEKAVVLCAGMSLQVFMWWPWEGRQANTPHRHFVRFWVAVDLEGYLCENDV